MRSCRFNNFEKKRKKEEAQSSGLCESRGGRPGLPVPNKPTVKCGRKATLQRQQLKFVLIIIKQFVGIGCSLCLSVAKSVRAVVPYPSNRPVNFLFLLGISKLNCSCA